MMPEPTHTQSASTKPGSTQTASVATALSDSVDASRPAPDLPQPNGEISDEAIADAIVETVLATPGVVRLEPTLNATGPKMLLRHSRTDGIQLTSRVNRLEIDINVATANTHQARTVAGDIRSRVDTHIATLGRPKGRVKINVLIIEDTDQ